MLGVGIHGFSKPLLKAYRDAVVDPDLGPKLAEIIDEVVSKGYGAGEKAYKRIPKGYDPNHKYAHLLQYGGLTSGVETGIPHELHTPELVEYSLTRYKDLASIVYWIEAMKAKSGL